MHQTIRKYQINFLETGNVKCVTHGAKTFFLLPMMAKQHSGSQDFYLQQDSFFLLRTTVITHFPKLGRKDNGKMIRNLSNKIDQYSKGEEKHRITQLKIP